MQLPRRSCWKPNPCGRCLPRREMFQITTRHESMLQIILVIFTLLVLGMTSYKYLQGAFSTERWMPVSTRQDLMLLILRTVPLDVGMIPSRPIMYHNIPDHSLSMPKHSTIL